MFIFMESQEHILPVTYGTTVPILEHSEEVTYNTKI